MKNTEEFLSDLHDLDIKVWIDGVSGSPARDVSLRCNGPKGTLTPDIRAELGERKDEIIAFLQKISLSSTFTLEPIRPISRNGRQPLSFNQERLWFLNQIEGESATYNELFAVSIKGLLQISHLEQSLLEIIQRHEVLRTTFPNQDGYPIQAIAPTLAITLPVVDLQALPKVEQSAFIQQLSKEVQRPFDLVNGPLLRVTLVQLEKESYVLLLCLHHIVYDGWSMGVFIQELSTLYQASCAGVPSPLPELPIQYADFAVWQRQWLSGEVLKTQLNYWLSQLNGVPSLLQLPTDRTRPVVQTYQGRTESFTLNGDLTQKLQSLCGKSGTTLFMTLLAAFATLLYRYSGESDILIGSPIANRNRSEIESLIGFFANTLVLRTRFEDHPSFESLLSQVRETTLKAYEHQDVPFEQIVQALQPVRDLSHTPLFQVMFILDKVIPMDEMQLPGLTWSAMPVENFTSKFDLTLTLDNSAQGLVGSWEYNTDLFDASTIERMAGHFEILLEGIVANPEQRVADLPLLTAGEQHQLLAEWNDTQKEYPEKQCIHQLFEEQVERTPDAVAVVFENQQLTYLQLNQRANQLAHHLQTLGVGPDVLVGICVERSVEMVIGLLGILKAGCAYVPLDPNYPQQRLAYMLDDSQIALLLTTEKLVAHLPEHSAQLVCLDTDWEAISTKSEKNPVIHVLPENLAYVIYTSGSTGRSKGVMVAHRSLVNAYWGWENAYQLCSLTSHLQMASFSFDVFSGDLIRALCSGAKLVLCPREWLLEPDKLYQLMLVEKIDSAEFVPAVLRNLVQYLERTKQNLHFMRLLVVGSDSLYVKDYEELKRFSSPDTRLINSYGVSEATIDSTYFEITLTNLPVDEAVPIGRPFTNTQIYILDRHLQPVPIGAIGELYIGGYGLAQGYLNRPELTEEKFIPNPFSQEVGARLYKTGDLACFLPNGNIKYLGRSDHQVKIRGFRIELGEIEAVLNTHPQIQQALVIAKEDIPGNKRLVAYVVPKDKSLTTNQLREFLKQQLPEYMVPSHFVLLDTLPLTPNGKIDRFALPAPDGVSSEQEYIAPRTPSEEIIANIFASVLGVQNVGIHDNFFSLGGHSLLATQLISRLRVAFSVEVPLRAVFESPTVTQLDLTITQLRVQDRGLTLPPIQPIEGDTELLPLSWAQERLWFLNQLEGSSATYNIPAAVCITGNIDLNALQQALSEIVRRHSVLRTSFPTLNGTPRQVIHPQATMNINVVDLQQLSIAERETVQKQLALEEAITPFNLEIAPLIRCSVLQLTATEYVLLLTMHHIVSDGWSMGVFISELSALYQAFCTGVPSELPELPLQYADFAVWQRQWLSGEVLETQLNYWRAQLLGAPSLLQLPTDRPRPVVQSYQGTTQSWTLNTDLTQKLQSLSAKSGTTLFMTLLAAFATLLYRYSDQSDILIGSAIANRNRSEIESLIGFFVNTLVLRTRFEDHPSFESLLSQVRETTLKAYEYQDVPFEQVVEALQPQRDLSYSPLFQVMFVLQNASMDEVELPGVTLTQLDRESTIAKFDLTLSMSETDQGLVGEWEYNTDLFDRSTIERMAAHFQNLLSAIVENPQLSVSELPLLSAAERYQLLVDWNDTESEYPADQCIHELFESQVEKTPLALAVVFENQQLTYLQLNQRANQLAHHLQTLGVGPEVLVGICVERSMEMVVGLLGILKAGGAYVPLDPNYPLERLSYMLVDSGVQVLVTHSELLSSLPLHTARVVCLDTDCSAIEQHEEDNLDAGVCSDNLAYVIYTSGSTGKPKGVAIEHHSLCNLAQAQRNLFDLQPTSRVLQFASVSFDASVWEIFMAVTTGAMLILGTASKLMPGDNLKQILHQERVTHVTLPSSALAVLPTDELPALGQIIVAGEACPLELVNQWSVGRRFFNAYGPTESTVCATLAQISHGSEKITIGRPISNTQIYILDQYLQPVPIGVPGELYIGGDGLARGYLNRPELTREKFIPNPFLDDKSERLYKTGDLACYGSDGNITFIGRVDNQVKIRGFRIELGEIESVLNSHPQIQQAVVIATEDLTGNKRLVAYIVSEDELLTTNQLREFLKQKLPEYQVPSAFVTLDTLPLTANGKVDRRALPAPNGEISREHEYVAPRTPTEEIIANIFASVLGMQAVGINDNFFSLGGHSLLATQLISRLRVAFEVEIELRAVFSFPTVAQLEQTITQLRTNERGLSLPLIQPRTQSSELPLSFAQERLWFLNQLEGASATYNIPGAIRISGNLDINALQQALSEIVRRHEILRTSFPTVNGTPIQVIHPQATMNINVVDLQQLEVTERETVLQQQVQLEAITPFDLENATLIRCSLVQLDAREYVLLLNMHHIVSDGWSIGIFIQELSSLYQANCAGVPSHLPELPIQYADFAVWQRQWLSGEVLKTQLNYWLSQLNGAPSLLQLPTDRRRPSVQTYQGRTESFTLNGDLTQKLQSLSRSSGTTLFMTLLAAFATLLYRYSGESDILIGSPIANRNRSEIESLIGFFVNTLVLRTRFEDHPSFESLLSQVRETTLKAYEHQDVPFEQVVEALQLQRDLSHSPLFQVMFVLHNTPKSELELPGCTWCELNLESTIAKFDLTLSITETDRGLVGSWEYNTDLFDRSTIERMAAHFQNLCSAIAENPEAAVGELPLLSAAERNQLLTEWNDTATPATTDKCIHQLFEQQVEKTPLAVAVVFENQQLTYQQLNQRANQLAHHLQTLGVGPEVLVGICVERSIEMVVGLLGILKAGGAYVPLDLTYPLERLSYMLADSGVQVLVTHSELKSSLPSHTARVVCLDTDCSAIEQHSHENLDVGVGGDNLAYVIYTSGSTGQPKGVLIEHKNVVRLFAATQSRYHFNANDVWTNFHSIAFDFSVWEIWGALFYGGRLVIVPYWISRDSQSFYNLLCSENVTVLNQTPSAFRQLIAVEKSDSTQRQLSLRLVIFGGEALELQSLKPWFEQHGDQSPQLVNMYGITETTVHVTYRPLTIKDLNSSGSVIGCPIPDLQMYILDDNLQPVPIGVKGQMYVGGSGLARGYLNRQQLNLERFIPNPFNHQLEQRLYKTGDLARYLPNSDIEYLGRIDNQVKVRGFRIELGEIEAALNSHPQIQQAVVITTEDLTGNKRLVAYVVSEDETLSTNQLREFLKQKLPEYMVPSAFVTLDSLPLTANGKVDRRALSAIDAQHAELNTDFVAPRTLEEELLAQIWSEVLGVEQVGIYDNFFELGGDSLLSVQVLAKANKCGLGLSLQQLFKHQTIHNLVKVLRQSDLPVSIVKTAPLSLISSEERQSLPNGVEDAYPLTRLQLGMLFHSEYAPETAIYHDVFSYYLQAPLNIQILHSAIKEIVTRHPVLRTSIAMTQFSQPLQLVHSQVSIELPVDDLSCLPLDEQQSNITTWIEQEKQRSFSWDAPPLARFHIHQRSCDTFNLSFSFHHAILDGWSVATLMTELVQHYLFLLGKTVPPLATVPNLTFRDYVALEQETLQSQECQRYWHEKLADFTVTELPRLPDTQQCESVEQVRTQEVEISAALAAQLKQFATKVGVPLKSVLLAAHLRVMSFLSNQADITTGVVTHGRPAAEDSERVLGLFLNTIPLRMQMSGGTWVELVEQTFEQERQALPFQQYPLAQLQQEVGLGQPLFESIFNYINFHVYQRLSGIDNLEVLGGQFFEQNNFTFVAQFSVDSITAEISLSLNYDPSLFSSEQVRSISGYYSAVLLAMVSQPEQRYEQVCLLSATERHQLLVEWNNTATPATTDKCIHQLFEQQVEKTPLAVAVVFENQQLTYSQLNQRANQLAHHLQTLSVGPEVLVGICVERSMEMVVGLLGILKAGGAYVPLDPTYPLERLSYMLADSGVQVLLTHSELKSSLPSHTARVVCLDTDCSAIEQHSHENLDVGVGGDNLAYVIYTSGSTGLPKGVQICHHSVVNFLNSMSHFPGLTQSDTFSAVTTISFDIAALELYLPLMVGAKVIVVPGEIATNGDLLLSKLFASKTTAMQATPATWQMLLAGGWSCDYPLKVFCGGEALPAQLAEQILETGSELWNLYGPTEATIWSTIYQVGANKTVARNEDAPSSIGRPISNTQIYILDSHLQPVPIGVPGELYIGGDGLALGYLHRPELTIEKFIANPFSQQERARLYKTGDLARYLHDGNIEYLGRIDHQVKIRGFRIELGEIEAVLTKHPKVQSAVVIARSDQPGDKRLVAYFVPNQPQVPTNSELRGFLQEKLPNYMLPSHFVLLESLPLTLNGKVNRRALPAPEGLRPDLEIAYAMPQNQLEQTIATVWQKALNLEKVGRYDNFFELGGHSLLIIQTYSQLREILQTDFPMLELFRYPTISSLAEYFSQTNNQKTFARQTESQAEKLITGKARLKQRREQIQSK